MNKFVLNIIFPVVLFFQLCAATTEALPKIYPLRQEFQFVDPVNKKLAAIENFKEDQLFYTEKFIWHPQFKELLSEHFLVDADHQVLLHQQLIYDSKGKLLQEKISNAHGEIFSFDVPEGFYESVRTDPCLSGIGYLQAQDVDQVKITFINGIMNTAENFAQSLNMLCSVHGDTTVHYVFKETEGFFWDFFSSFLIKFGYVSQEAHALADLWKKLIHEIGGVDGEGHIIHYAHSVGGANTNAAKYLLNPEELQMIEVVTLGSPVVLSNNGFKSVLNYMSIADAILFLDPLSHLSALFSNDENGHIIYVGDEFNISIEDHYLEGKSYKKVLESHGQAFIDLYKK